MALSYGYWKILIPMRLYENNQFENLKESFMVIARASRPNKRRLCKPIMHSTFPWHIPKLSSLTSRIVRFTVGQSLSCLERVNLVRHYIIRHSQHRMKKGNYFKLVPPFSDMPSTQHKKPVYLTQIAELRALHE